MSLKESIPVVDILPTIDEEPESVEEDHSLKRVVADLEQNEENIQSVIENNEVADLSIDRSHPFIECDALEYTVEDNKLPTKDTKLINFNADCTSLESGEELQISVENVLNHVETDNVFKSTLKLPQMHNYEKEYQSKLQNNCIKIVEEIGATQIKSLCPETDTLLKTGEEVDKRNEVILNQFDSNHITNTTCHVPQEMGTRVECNSERNVEKVVEVDEKVRSKGKKKKFHTLRKWLGNLCCCARKRT